jgi:long-chain acyl-CoA synthetase
MNVAENVARGSRLFPDKPALIFESMSFTYKQLNGAANRVANGLRRLGINPGDRVALMLPNIPEFVFCYLGILKAGSIAVSLNVMLKCDEVKFILNDCEAKVLIVAEVFRDSVPPACPYLRHVLTVRDSAGRGECGTGTLSECDRFASLEELMGSASSEGQAMDMEPNAPAAIIYTSGTTGFPKGAILSHGNVVSNSYAANHCCRMRREDKFLLYLPLFHCFGQNFILNAGLNVCGTIVLQRRFDALETLKAIVDYEITMFFGVPPVFIKLLALPASGWDLSSVRYYFTAAASMPVEVARQWQSRYGKPIYEGYGLTETSPFASYNNDLQYKLGTIGTPIENVEMKVVDAEGRELPPGEVGEIVVRGPNVMLGYWKRPVETERVLQNGWLHTGDLGNTDEQGYFYLVDRLKDMINMSGFKVYPAEVERVLYEHPAVREAAVFGVPDPEKGDRVVAHVRLRDGCEILAADLQAFCRERMATYKVPQVIKFVASIPKNPTGKVLKRLLREREMVPVVRAEPLPVSG